MDITLYSNYSKEKNSTDIPTGIGRTIDGVTREPFSILAPVIGLQFPPDYFPGEYNYMYAPELNRYYYITDWTYSGGLWYATCSVDAIASWRDDILDSWLYVLRSEAECNPYLSDLTYATTQQVTLQKTLAAGYGWKGSFNEGCLVLGLINDDTQALGAVTYYVFNPFDARQFCSQLLLNSDYLEVSADELSPAMQQLIFNPFQYIASAYWFPFDIPEGELVGTPTVGWWAIQSVAFARRLPRNAYGVQTFTFDVLSHPLYADTTKYMAAEPFSSAVLYMPGFGEIEVPLSSFVDQFQTPEFGTQVPLPKLECRMHIDYVTGRGIMTLINEKTRQPLCTREAQIGVPIQISSLSINTSGNEGLLHGVGHMAANAASYLLAQTGTNLGAAAGAAVQGVFNQRAATVEKFGTNGMITQFTIWPELRFQFQMFTEYYSPHIFGFPLCARRKLRTLPGFVKAVSEGFVTAATPAERAEIENAIREGMYISRFEDE